MPQISGRLFGGPFSVFIIGPMGDDKDAPRPGALSGIRSVLRGRKARAEQDRVPVSRHTRHMGEAARNVLGSLGLPERAFEVFVPDQLMNAAIVESVFHHIDMADLAIADISTPSRNVMYEVAFFNALGTPLILIDRKGNTQPFYLNQSRMVVVEDFTVAELTDRLAPVLGAFLRGEDLNLTQNPISQFYGAALVDVSAATGVAVGFFENFAQHVLAEGGVIAQNPAIRELVMIRPRRINDLTQDERRLRDRLDGAQRVTLDAPTHPRKNVTARVLGDAIIDFPTPLYALDSAPRYRKLRERMRGMSPSEERVDAMMAKLEAQIVAAYFRMIESLIKDRGGIGQRSWRIVDIDAFAEEGLPPR